MVLVDDLEFERSSQAVAVFDRYRRALDTMLPQGSAGKAAVHFLVNMLEAYYFANTNAVNSVLGINLEDFDGDVETIRHPKNELKRLHAAFDEKKHGPLIVRGLDVAHVLSRADACASLRTMFAWVAAATRSSFSVPDGRRFAVTESQLETLQ